MLDQHPGPRLRRPILCSRVSDRENDDDAFVGPIASWFVLIDDRLQNQTDSKHKYGLHKASSIRSIFSTTG